MKINIYTEKRDLKFDFFVKNIVPKFLKTQYLKNVNIKHFINIDKEFEIDSNKICLTALNNLSVNQVENYMYIISVNKNIKVNNESIMTYINEITYGNRSVKGYPILNDIFKFTSEHIKYLFGRWKDGYKIL